MKYSVIIPIHNEQESIVELLLALEESLTKEIAGSYEIVIVDDGSTDASVNHCSRMMNKIKNLKIIALDKRYGKSAALTEGFKEATGQIIITLDGDFQDLPSQIPKLLDKQSEGYDFVIGFRHSRKDSSLKILISKFANLLVKRLSGVQLQDMGCNLRVFKKNILEKIHLHEGLHRYLAVIAAIEGFKVAEVKVDHQKRSNGKSKYTTVGRFFNTCNNLAMFISRGKKYWRTPQISKTIVKKVLDPELNHNS